MFVKFSNFSSFHLSSVLVEVSVQLFKLNVVETNWDLGFDSSQQNMSNSHFFFFMSFFNQNLRHSLKIIVTLSYINILSSFFINFNFFQNSFKSIQLQASPTPFERRVVKWIN